MAKYKFTDSAGREAYKDDRGYVYTEGGNNPTGYNLNQWNQRQQNKYGGGNTSYSNNFAPSTDFGANFNNVNNIYKQNGNPIVDALKKSLGNYDKSFQQQESVLKGREQPMKDRYKNLMDIIKGNQSVAETRQSTATTQELGRRGLSMDSGVAQQQLTDQLNPITQQYTGTLKDLGIQQEMSLMDLAEQIAQLTGQRASVLGGIESQIGQTQMSALENALSLAGQLSTMGESTRQFNQNFSKSSEVDPIKEKLNAYLLSKLSGGTGSSSPQYSPKAEGTRDGEFVYTNGQWKKDPDLLASQFGF